MGDLLGQIAASEAREHPPELGNPSAVHLDARDSGGGADDKASPRIQEKAVELFDPETGEFYELAVQLPSIEEEGREPFGRWLLQQQKRGGWIGQLAKAAKGDPAFPKQADPEEVRKHLGARGADGDMFEAIDDAELEWLAY